MRIERRAIAAAVLIGLVPTQGWSEVPIFEDDFERPDCVGPLVPPWTGASGSGGTISIIEEPATQDCVLDVDAAGVSVTLRALRDFMPQDASALRVSFDLKMIAPSFSHEAGLETFDVTSVDLQGDGNDDADVELRVVNIGLDPENPDLRYRLAAEQGASTCLSRVDATAPPVTPGVWQHLEIVHASASAGEADGSVRLYIDGGEYPAISLPDGDPCMPPGLDNAAQRVLEDARLGITSSPSAPFQGELLFDDYSLAELFRWGDGFEDGAGAWDGIGGPGISVAPDPTMGGPGGSVLEVDAQGLVGQTSRVVKGFPGGEPFGERVVFEFDFHADKDLMLADGGSASESVGIFSAQFDGAIGLPDLVLRIVNIDPSGTGDLRWALRALPDDGGPAHQTPHDATAPPVAVDEWTHIRIEYEPSDPGMENGVVKLFLDDDLFPALVLSGIDNDAYTTLDEVRLGVAEVSSSPLTGVLLFSRFAADEAVRPLEFGGSGLLGDDGALYRVTLWDGFDAVSGQLPPQVVIEGTDVGTTLHSGVATVTVTRADQPDGSVEWGISVVPDPTSSYGVYRVEFPLLLANPIPGAGDEQLIVPDGIGRVIPDPLDAIDSIQPNSSIPIQKSSIWYGTYGSKQQSLQLMAYEKAGHGLLIYTQDPDLNLKDFEFSGDTKLGYYGPGKRIAVHHYPANTGAPGVGWSNPYPVVVREYQNGWYAAVRTHYRPWALQQKWADGGTLMARIRSGALPGWYVNNALWSAGISGQELPLLREVRDRVHANADPNVQVGVGLSQWQYGSFNGFMPRYFPPLSESQGTGCPDGCWYFDYLDEQDSGLRVSPYFNVHVARIDVQTGEAIEPVLRFEDPTTPNALDPGAPDTETIYAEELPGLLAGVYSEEGGQNLPMCRGAADWRAYFREISARNLQSHEPELFDAEFGEYGTDSQYFDQVAPGSVYPCFATDHGHAPGFGDYLIEGIRGLAEDALADAGPRILVSEGNAEGYVDAIQEAYAIHPPWWSAMTAKKSSLIVPLFPAVYHGYVSLHEWPNYLPDFNNGVDPDLDAFASALAMPAHLGNKPGSFVTTVTWKKLFEYPGTGCREESEAACAVLDDLVQVTARTMDAWAYGERLADPVVLRTDGYAEQAEVTWCQSLGDGALGSPCLVWTNLQVPVVQASLWRSLVDSNRLALVLSNWSGGAVEVTVQSPDIPNATLIDVQGGPSLVYSNGAQVTVGARDFLVFVSQELDDPDGDFVSNAGGNDNCPTTHNPAQTDSNSDGVGDACSLASLPAPVVAGEDGWVREASENSNKGKDVNALDASCASGLAVGDDDSDRQSKGLLSFDTSGLPDSPDLVILGARLTLPRGADIGSPSDLGALQVEVSGAPFAGASALEKGDFEASEGVAAGIAIPGSTAHLLDLDSGSLGEIVTDGTTQIRLSTASTDDDDGATDQWAFCPGESATPPTLVIDYTE